MGRQKGVGVAGARLGYSLQDMPQDARRAAGLIRIGMSVSGHIAVRTAAFRRAKQPAISVDTKKKELVGNYKNGGREWYPVGQPPDVKAHDFMDKKLGRAIPYGVYDLAANVVG